MSQARARAIIAQFPVAEPTSLEQFKYVSNLLQDHPASSVNDTEEQNARHIC